MDLFDIYQHSKIQEATAQANRAKNRVESFERSLKVLERRVETLSLTCQALWELLRQISDLTDEHVIQKMQEIDLRDGVADGKIAQKIVVCPKCQRNSNSKRKICLYCGNDLPVSHLFERG